MEGEVQAPTGEGSGPAQVQDGARITVEQLRRFASNAGITLHPWQEGIALAVLNGEPVEWYRRSGRVAMSPGVAPARKHEGLGLLPGYSASAIARHQEL